MLNMFEKKNLNNKEIYNVMNKGVMLVFLIVLLMGNASALYIGITDGYIKYINDSVVNSASVSASVSGCSGGAGNGCTGSATSDSNGYYIISNLNLPKSGNITITATKNTGSGNTSGTADIYQVAHVNVSICYSPTTPSLTAVADSHLTTAIFTWVSGTDPESLAKHDQLSLDNNITNPAVSPVTRTSLSFASHTWKARTCNNYCCGSWASDTFVLSNSAPSIPTNPNATQIGNELRLNWTSGVDSDGDTIYDEFRYSNGTIVTPVTAPFNVTFASLVSWEVRTCDSYLECSAWLATDSVTCNGTSGGTCTTCNCPGTGSGCYSTTTTIYSNKSQKTEIYCNGVNYKSDLLFRVLITTGEKNKISIYGSNWSSENLEYCPWCYDGKKDYDEIGVDCGRSCRECTKEEEEAGLKITAENPVSRFPIKNVFLIAGGILAIGLVYFAYKFFSGKKT